MDPGGEGRTGGGDVLVIGIDPRLEPFYSTLDGTRLVGCYLSPPVFLRQPRYDEPSSAIEILWTISTGDRDLLVTVNGGLFVRIPDDLPKLAATDRTIESIRAQQRFEQDVSFDLNLVICELATRGVVSEPASPAYISPAFLIDNCALITSAGGNREIYLDRTLGWSLALANGTWLTKPVRAIPTEAAELPHATRIAALSVHAPTLVATAYSSCSRMHHAETLLLAWIVIEQFLDSLWQHYASVNATRKEALKDGRTYSAAVRIELLHAIGHLKDTDRELFDEVRKDRNKLAHRGEVKPEAGRRAASALTLVLRELCGPTVEPLIQSTSVGW